MSLIVRAVCRMVPPQSAVVYLLVTGLLLLGGSWSWAQGRFTDVLVSVVKDKIVAVSGTRQSEIELSVGETVVSAKSHGLTALAITSARLLGFSSTLSHWSELPLDGDEHVSGSHVIRELCIVATDQHLYGFQEPQAHWSSDALGVNEHVRELRADGHVALAVTTTRLVGLSAFVNGFHALDLQGDEQPQAIEHTGDAYLVRTTRRTLMFRSRIAGWTEMN